MQAFRFDDLGWLQFERACFELVELEGGPARAEWTRPRWGSSCLLREGYERRGLRGPAVVLVLWARTAEAVPRAVAHTLLEWRQAAPRSLLLLTNLRVADVAAQGVETVVLGPDELTRIVASSPALRMRVPSLVGIADLDALVETEVRDRSTLDVDGASQLARVFVPTRAYAHALAVVERHRFAVLTGPPEMGKTAIARMLGLAALTAGWEVHECVRPDELWARLARDRRQVFIADDAFGSTEYRPEAAERWALELDRMLRALDERHRLIWTSRPAPLKAALRRIHREHGVERWPQPAEVQVDAAQLDVAEKALILFRHAKAARLTAKDVVRAQGWRIVSHEHFTPERIRRFVARLPELEIGDDLDELVAREIREPTAAMSASFHALAPEHRALLVALLDTPPGPVAERELVAAFRRHTATGFTTSPTELVDRLADHFLRIVEQGSVTWVHPSWRDLVIDELVREAQARRTFLHASSIDGVLLALSTAGGAAGERILPLLLDDADWDAIGDRLAELAPKLEGPDITRLVGALTEALRTVRDGRRSEPEALAAYALELLARRWDRSRAPIPVGLLAEWFELESQLPRPRSRPQLTATWIDLAPTDRIDVESAPEVAQFDDWVALVELLTARAPDALARFGSVAARSRIVGRFVADVSRTPPQRVEQVRQLLLRLSALAPEHDASIRRALVQLSFAPEHHEFPPVYQPRRELSPELQRILDAPSASPRSDETLVARVLRDL